MIDLFTILIVAIIIAFSFFSGLLFKTNYLKRKNRISRNIRFFEDGKQVNYANLYDIWHKTETGWDHHVAQIEGGEIKYYTDDKLISHKEITENI